MTRRTVVPLLTALSAGGLVGGCDDPVPPPAPTKVTVSPTATALPSLGDTVRLTATVLDQHGEPMPKVAVVWSSGDPSVASVEHTSGLVTAVANGTATVTATADSVRGTASVTVDQVAVGVTVEPETDTLEALDDTLRLAAQAFDANGHSVAHPGFAWRSDDEAVATVQGDGDSGLVTAVGNGAAQVTASVAEVAASATVTVRQRPSVVRLTPDTATLEALDDTLRLAAQAFDANGHSVPDTEFAWRSDDDDVATVQGDGNYGLVTAVRNGAAQVTASVADVAASAAVTVRQRPTEVRLTPDTATLEALDDTLRLAAQAFDANGHSVAHPGFAWRSDDEAVATVQGDGDSGLVTAVGNGAAQVTASVAEVAASATVTVRQRPSVVRLTPDTATLEALDDTLRLAAQAFDANGHSVPDTEFAWRSDDDDVATVQGDGNYGLVTAVRNGAAQVTASVADVAASAAVTVRQRPTEVRLTPDTATLEALDDTVRLAAQAFDANGHSVADAKFAWRSNDEAVATVRGDGNAGLVTAVRNGAAQVTASVADMVASAAVTVRQRPTEVRVTPEDATVAMGDTLRLAAEAFDANGHRVAEARFLWKSYDGPWATVDASGLVTGVREGFAVITATAGDAEGGVEVRVVNPDRAALAALYHATGGPSWIHSANWLTHLPPGFWYGVTTDDFGRVELLDLHRNGLEGPIPPELGDLEGLRNLGLGYNRLTGAIPPELGRLGHLWEMHLRGNRLTGPIPPELGDLADLEKLFLEENDLSGPIPTEFGDLESLNRLELSHNRELAGALPTSLTDLGLDTLMASGTDLCAPRNPAFDDWLETIARLRVARCGEAMAYLVQTVQSRTHPVPLVAGEKALLRVFVTARKSTDEGLPLVRARFHLDGTELHVVDIPAKSTPIPTEVDEGDLSKSANAEIPGRIVAAGLEMVIEIDPDGTLDEDLGVPKRIPEEGRLAVDVRRTPVLNLTAIPFLWSEDPDSAILEAVEEMEDNPEGDDLLEYTHILLPVGALDVTAHDPVTSTSNSALDLLAETEAIRVLEGGGGHYMGMMSGRVTVAVGAAYVPGRSSFSKPASLVIAHELGHNMSLWHAPCGNPAGVDPAFPDPEGRTGAWGYDFERDSVVSSSLWDLMSYCDPQWIGDYHFANALRHRLADEGEPGAPAPSLLLWGGVAPDGKPFLNPAFVWEAPAALPDSAGDYTVTGRDADGGALFSLSFTMPAVADQEEGASSFAFALPVRSGWADALAGITLSGPGGRSATLGADGDRPMAILVDRASRRVRAILRDAAAPPPADGDTEVLFSRGIPDSETWRR